MSGRGGSMKSFFQEKKKRGGSTPKAASSTSKKQKSSPSAATLGAASPQPSALISHGSPDLKDDIDASEEVLRQFDMNMKYGPCIGMNRLARWERASKLGMNPPEDVAQLLRCGKVRSECLWDGRV